MARNNLELTLSITSANLADAFGEMRADALRVERWAPGDGRARYRLMYRDRDGFEWECGPYFQGVGAFEDALAMLRNLAWHVAKDRNKARAAMREMEE